MKKIEDLFVDFLTKPEGIDLLPFAYMDSNSYNDIITSCDSYYLFHDEVNIINNNKHKIAAYLDNIDTLIEIGPGSPKVILSKTLPILQSLKSRNVDTGMLSADFKN